MKINFIIVFIIIIKFGNILPLNAQFYPGTKNVKRSYNETLPRGQIIQLLNSSNKRINPQSIMEQTDLSIEVNPTNNKNLLIGLKTEMGLGYYYSFDGGETWNGKDELIGENVWRWYPRVSFDADGIAYLNYTEEIGYPYVRVIRVRKSTDGGMIWLNPTTIPDSGDFDINNFVIDITNTAYRNSIYVSYTDYSNYPERPMPIMFSKSTNRGVSFSTPVDISRDSNGLFFAGVDLAVSHNGNIYAIWAIYDDWDIYEQSTWAEDGIGFARSTNGGNDLESKRILDIEGIYNLWYHKNPNQYGVLVNGFPSIAVDNSNSPFRGTIYVVWSDRRLGDPDIFLIKSTNGGVTWSSHVRVNQDNEGNGIDQWHPAITINNDGVINIIFYDSRSDTNNQMTDVWIAQSTDGGESFKDFKVSENSFLPYSTNYIYDPFGYMGWYIGIASTKEYAFSVSITPCLVVGTWQPFL